MATETTKTLPPLPLPAHGQSEGNAKRPPGTAILGPDAPGAVAAPVRGTAANVAALAGILRDIPADEQDALLALRLPAPDGPWTVRPSGYRLPGPSSKTGRLAQSPDRDHYLKTALRGPEQTNRDALLVALPLIRSLLMPETRETAPVLQTDPAPLRGGRSLYAALLDPRPRRLA